MFTTIHEQKNHTLIYVERIIRDLSENSCDYTLYYSNFKIFQFNICTEFALKNFI